MLIISTGYIGKKTWNPTAEQKAHPRLNSVLMKNALMNVGSSLVEKNDGFKLRAGDKAITFIFIEYEGKMVHRNVCDVNNPKANLAHVFVRCLIDYEKYYGIYEGYLHGEGNFEVSYSTLLSSKTLIFSNLIQQIILPIIRTITT